MNAANISRVVRKRYKSECTNTTEYLILNLNNFVQTG